MFDSEWRWVAEDGTPIAPGAHPVERTLQTGEALRGRVVGLRRVHGGQRWMSVDTQPLFGRDHAIEGAINVPGRPDRAALATGAPVADGGWRGTGDLGDRLRRGQDPVQ